VLRKFEGLHFASVKEVVQIAQVLFGEVGKGIGECGLRLEGVEDVDVRCVGDLGGFYGHSH
jgi:hypothetical protein